MLNLTSINDRRTRAQITETITDVDGRKRSETRHLKRAIGGYRDAKGRTYQIDGNEVSYGGASIAE